MPLETRSIAITLDTDVWRVLEDLASRRRRGRTQLSVLLAELIVSSEDYQDELSDLQDE